MEVTNNGGQPANPSGVTVAMGGRNAILFILTRDLLAGYALVAQWLQENGQFRIYSLVAQPVNLTTPIVGQAAQGFGITVICEIAPPVPAREVYNPPVSNY